MAPASGNVASLGVKWPLIMPVDKDGAKNESRFQGDKPDLDVSDLRRYASCWDEMEL